MQRTYAVPVHMCMRHRPDTRTQHSTRATDITAAIVWQTDTHTKHSTDIIMQLQQCQLHQLQQAIQPVTAGTTATPPPTTAGSAPRMLLTGCSAAAAARTPFSPSALSLRLRCRSCAVASAAATSRSASSASSSCKGNSRGGSGVCAGF